MNCNKQKASAAHWQKKFIAKYADHLRTNRVGKKSLPTLQITQSPPRRVGTVFVPTRNARITTPSPRTHPHQKKPPEGGHPVPTRDARITTPSPHPSVPKKTTVGWAPRAHA